jgi:hypothetical protein
MLMNSFKQPCKKKSGLLAMLALVCALFPGTIMAQLEFGGRPVHLPKHDQSQHSLYYAVDFEVVENSRSVAKYPLRAGYTIPVQLNPQTHGHWTDLKEKGLKVWQLHINISDYAGLALYFDAFELDNNARFFVFDAGGTTVIGAFSGDSKGNAGQFSTRPVYSTHIIIQLEVPADKSDFLFSISELGFVYPENKNERGIGNSGNCNVNVNCPEGAQWQSQKNGVARILVKLGNSLFWCSGSLVNNTRQDGTPYFLTANHCGPNVGAADLNQWLFYFNYESENCTNPLIEPVPNTMTGASFLASSPGQVDQTSDFMLLMLNQDVPDTYEPFYNGWSAVNSITSSGVGIHHPSGDIKKISTFTNQPISSSFGTGQTGPDQRYWRLTWSATESGHGVTEGGSSGSPLFDNNGRIVGALTGGAASCANLLGPDFYGKFSYSWESNGLAANRQLKPWLDPDNTGITLLNGFGGDTSFVNALFEADATELLLNQFVQFEQKSIGDIRSYQWFFEGGEPSESSEKNPPPVRYSSFGSFDVRLIVKGSNSADTLLKAGFVNVRALLYPNPAKEEFFLNLGRNIPDELEINIFELSGRAVGFDAWKQGHSIRIRLHTTGGGFYIVQMKGTDIERSLKVIITP